MLSFDIGAFLTGVKDKVLDVKDVETLRSAYAMQEQVNTQQRQIIELKDQALQMSRAECESLRRRVVDLEKMFSDLMVEKMKLDDTLSAITGQGLDELALAMLLNIASVGTLGLGPTDLYELHANDPVGIDLRLGRMASQKLIRQTLKMREKRYVFIATTRGREVLHQAGMIE